jgi:hypothetical protein
MMQVPQPAAFRRAALAVGIAAVLLGLVACTGRPLVRDVHMGSGEPAHGGTAVPRDEYGNPILEPPRRRSGWW